MAWSAVDVQLERDGLRLAELLNEVLIYRKEPVPGRSEDHLIASEGAARYSPTETAYPHRTDSEGYLWHRRESHRDHPQSRVMAPLPTNGNMPLGMRPEEGRR